MSFLTQTLKALSAMRPAHSFWPIWIVITAAAAIFVVVGVRPVAASRSANVAKHPINLMPYWRQVAPPGAVATLTFLAIFLVFYIAMTLAWEDFTYYDNSDFTFVTLQGHDLIIQATPATGRFFPLAFQEYNLIRHFSNTITGYHVLSIIQLLILSFILLVFDTELSIVARAALAILALLSPSIFFSFNALILPERNIVFFLACLMLSVRRFEQTRSIAWALAAVVSVQFMIYYKETTFLLVLGFAAGRLLLRCRNTPGPGWDYKRLWDSEGRLDLCLAALAVLFLLYYMARLVFYHYVGGQGIYGNTNYAAKYGVPLAQVVLAYARVDLLAWLLVAVVLGRSYLILRNRTAPSLLWDGLAFGGVVCLFAYLRLGMFGMYYLAPVDLIAVLYVGRFAVLSWPKMRSWSKAAALVLIFTVLVQTVSVSTYLLFEEKNLIHAKAEIASVVEARYRSGGGTVLSLFFPFASPWAIEEFASYLNYRGVPVDGAGGDAAGLNRVILATPSVTEDGPCVWAGYRPIRCHAAGAPAPGDMVIVFPDDEATSATASVYRKPAELLFSYKPFPSIPPKLFSLVGKLTIVGIRTKGTPPDRWMDGSVAVWK